MLRSGPSGRFGFANGSSPFAMRSVQSARYWNGAPPSRWPAWLIICWPDWPDMSRRAHASSPFMCANMAGSVRVDSCPSWWQPMQAMFFTLDIHSFCVTFSGILPLPPKSSGFGKDIIEYQ
jgi:hypothetical protein